MSLPPFSTRWVRPTLSGHCLTQGVPADSTPEPAASAPANVPAAVTGPPGGPVVFFSDVQVGPIQDGRGGLGVPITLFGKALAAQRGDSSRIRQCLLLAGATVRDDLACRNPCLESGQVTALNALRALGVKQCYMPFTPTRVRELLK